MNQIQRIQGIQVIGFGWEVVLYVYLEILCFKISFIPQKAAPLELMRTQATL